jgi:hypothetical protein
MAYLIDSNTFIEAKNGYYGLDLCPGFWDWLERQNRAKGVYSIDRVRTELRAIKDELTEWADDRGDSFFLPLDAPASAAMLQVAATVQRGGFTDQAVNLFMAGADPFLIAYAMAHGHTVITHEVHVEGARKKVKIPTICRMLHVPCIRTFDMLRNESARFVLGS